MIQAAYVYHHSHILWTSTGLRALRCVLVVHTISTYDTLPTVLLVMKKQHENKSSMPFEVVLLADVLLCQMKNLDLVSAAVLEVLIQHKLTIVLRVVCLLLVSFLHFFRLLKIL